MHKAEKKALNIGWDRVHVGKVFGFAVMGSVLFTGINLHVAMAQVDSREAIELQNQILQLKSQVTQLQTMGLSSGDDSQRHHKKHNSDGDAVDNSGGSGGLVTQLLTRVGTLEENQRELRGQVEDLTNQFQTQIAALNKKIDDGKFVAGQGNTGNDSVSDASSLDTNSSRNSPAPTASVRPTLKDGQQALLQRNYSSAEAIARQVMSTSTGKNSVNAKFLLAQSLAGQRRFKESAVAYYDIYKQTPSSIRAPEALLGVSASLLVANQKKQACEALSLLNAKYPNSSARVKGAAGSLAKRGGCS